MQDIIFDELKAIFKEKGKRLYLVGGSARDLLLGREYFDHDMATDATPLELKEILPEANFTFIKYGSVRLKINNEEVDITSLREEGEYNDSRHPAYLNFIKDPKIDSLRRDFSINAIYIDEDYNILDFHNGVDDLKKKVIRFIGDPKKRVEEDPLRIIRGERFAKVLNFEIEKESLKAMEEGKELLNRLNPRKIEEESRKLKKGMKV